MTQEQRLRLIATAVQLAHGEDWTVTASYDGSRENLWAIERRTKGKDVWIGRGPTLDDALAMASRAYVESLRNHAVCATRCAAQLGHHGGTN